MSNQYKIKSALEHAEIALSMVICPSDPDTHANDIKECELALMNVRNSLSDFPHEGDTYCGKTYTKEEILSFVKDKRDNAVMSPAERGFFGAIYFVLLNRTEENWGPKELTMSEDLRIDP